MRLSRPEAELYFPRATGSKQALDRTTHLGIGAHQDDVEILAAHGIIECYQSDEREFSAAIVSDGAGSARSGRFAAYTDDQMKRTRREEQRKAAEIGGYLACVQMQHPSSDLKEISHQGVVEDLVQLLDKTRPEVVYTHNLCDRHDTHVALALRVIDAVRLLPEAHRPRRLIGCEVWRDLDWLPDPWKVSMDLSPHPELQRRLLEVFQSQIAGGKRYDEATLGRRRAHATFSKSHEVDRCEAIIFGMDLSLLARDASVDPVGFTDSAVEAFGRELRECQARMSGR